MELAPDVTSRKWRWSFPVCKITPKVAIKVEQSVVGLMGLHDCICRAIVPLLVSEFFTSLILHMAAEEVYTNGGG